MLVLERDITAMNIHYCSVMSNGLTQKSMQYYKANMIDCSCLVNLGKSLDDLIVHCKSLLESIPDAKHAESNWTKRMTCMQEDWTKARSSIFDWVVSDEDRHSEKCSFCLGGDANIRCHHCGLSFYLCNACDDKIHSSNPFHDREIWNHCEGSRTLGLGFGLGLGRTFNCIQSPKSRIFETFFLVIGYFLLQISSN